MEYFRRISEITFNVKMVRFFFQVLAANTFPYLLLLYRHYILLRTRFRGLTL